MPYPSSPSIIAAEMSRILATIPSQYRSSAQTDLTAYGAETWNLDKHRSFLQPLNTWKANHPTSNPKLWCAEFGSLDHVVFGGGCDPSDRIQFISDRRQAFEESGIGWAYWSFNETFTVLDPLVRQVASFNSSSDWIDEEMLHALGVLCGTGDINCDNTVDSKDLFIMMEQWMQNPNFPPYAGIAPPAGNDNFVDFLDFAVLAEYWLMDVAPY